MDLSTRLSFLFGTEEYVDMRRQLVLLRETLLNHEYRDKNRYFICSGSLGEGVAYPESDDDLMNCTTNSRVVQKYREATQKGDVLMVPSEYYPGYCLLLDVRGSMPGIFIQIINEMPFVSSTLFKHSFPEAEFIHGPCLSGGVVGISEYDWAYCFPCYSWPDIAIGWVQRERSYGWPSFEIIQNVVRKGCHVVPVGDPDSPYSQHEWRISFSVAERSLMHSFNHTQFLVYNILRLTLKRIIGTTLPDILCSYFMKTTLFYTVENTPLELWQEDNIEICFKYCLSALYDYVDYRNCPNYFIPEYNMIKRKIDYSNRQQMLDLIRTVHLNGIIGVLHMSGESRCLDDRLSAQMMERKLDVDFMFSDHLNQCTIRITPCMLQFEINDCLNIYSFWHLLKCIPITDDLINIIWNRGINLYCQKMMDYLFTSPKMNKQNYRLYKSIESLLRIGFRGDVTTGKLTMATYMYMVGKTESALSVIRNLLSEYPPYAIDEYDYELKKTTYMDVMCGRGYTIYYKVRRAYSPLYDIENYWRNAFPSSLRIFITIIDKSSIDPISYAYFLESVCHIQHQNQRLIKKSLKSLVDHVNCMTEDLSIAVTKMCVGIIMFLQGDNQSACRWLSSVYLIAKKYPPPISERLSFSVSSHIALLLNKNFNR